jgi:pilus assembly protein CpaF
VRNVLHMRPNRIIVGEVRGGEAISMLQAMYTGHDGSLTTLHANSPLAALGRLETLAAMAEINLASAAIRDLIIAAVQLVVHVKRFSDGTRRITHISEVTGRDEQQFILSDIFRFRQTRTSTDGQVMGDFVPTGFVPTSVTLPLENFLDQWA